MMSCSIAKHRSKPGTKYFNFERNIYNCNSFTKKKTISRLHQIDSHHFILLKDFPVVLTVLSMYLTKKILLTIFLIESFGPSFLNNLSWQLNSGETTVNVFKNVFSI